MRRGDFVVYRPHPGAAEIGVVMEVRATVVMVRYGTDEHAKATRPGDLTVLQVPA